MELSLPKCNYNNFDFNTAGYYYSYVHKRSVQDDGSYHTCPYYGTVSIFYVYRYNNNKLFDYCYHS